MPVNESSRDPLLRVRDLTVAFGTASPVVRQLSFDLHSGETLGIVGESGSGKSMTALSIMGLLPRGSTLRSGSLRLRGVAQPLNTCPESELRKLRARRMGMIFQEPMSALNPVLRCGRQLTEVLQQHLRLSAKEAYERALHWLAEVQLPEPKRVYNAYPHELSGGQQQRVMIAMALCCKPDLLIADEPTTALDVTIQRRILELMHHLQEEYQLAMLFITHDLGVLRKVAQRALVLQQGYCREQGSVHALFTHATHPYTRGLIACRPPLDRKLYRLPTIADFEANRAPRSSAPANPPSAYADSVNPGQQVLLRVQDLYTYFPIRGGLPWQKKDWIKAVDGVSFDIRRGETLGLVGESGSGKTTLGRSLLRLVQPQRGQLFYGEQDLLRVASDDWRPYRRDLQIIFQNPNAALNPRQPIGLAIEEAMRVHFPKRSPREREERCVALLERVGLLADHRLRFPHEFSGGQRQRICIARALAVEPKFIVCDEMVSALDVSVQAQVLNLLKELQEERQLTYLFISHDLSVIRFVSDRIAVMRNGKILELAEAEAIYSHPQTSYTRELLDAVL